MIYDKINKLMEALPYVQKKGYNTFHKYRYVAHSDLMAELRPHLVRLGIVATPEYSIVSQTGDLVIVQCLLTLGTAEDKPGDRTHVTSLGSGSDKGDKAVMKAMTAANKYAWMHLLALATGDDPEADADTDRRAAGTKDSELTEKLKASILPPLAPGPRPVGPAGPMGPSFPTGPVKK